MFYGSETRRVDRLHIAYDYAYAGSLSMRTASDTSSSFGAKAIQISTYLDVGTRGK